MAAVGTFHRLYRSFRIGLIRELPHDRDVQPRLGGEKEPQEQFRSHRERMQHDRCAHCRIVRRAEKGRRRELEAA